jgi:hypothetical protein
LNTNDKFRSLLRHPMDGRRGRTAIDAVTSPANQSALTSSSSVRVVDSRRFHQSPWSASTGRRHRCDDLLIDGTPSMTPSTSSNQDVDVKVTCLSADSDTTGYEDACRCVNCLVVEKSRPVTNDAGAGRVRRRGDPVRVGMGLTRTDSWPPPPPCFAGGYHHGKTRFCNCSYRLPVKRFQCFIHTLQLLK